MEGTKLNVLINTKMFLKKVLIDRIFRSKGTTARPYNLRINYTEQSNNVPSTKHLEDIIVMFPFQKASSVIIYASLSVCEFDIL